MNRGVYPGGTRGNRPGLQTPYSGARYLATGVTPTTLPNSSDTAIPLDYRRWDTEQFWDPQQPTRLTARQKAIYRVGGCMTVPMGGGTTGWVDLVVYSKDPGGGLAQARNIVARAGIGNISVWAPSAAAVVLMNAGDYVQMEANQQTGVNQSVATWSTPGTDEAVALWIRRLTL